MTLTASCTAFAKSSGVSSLQGLTPSEQQMCQLCTSGGGLWVYLIESECQPLDEIDFAGDLQGSCLSCVQHSNHLLCLAFFVSQHLIHCAGHLHHLTSSLCCQPLQPCAADAGQQVKARAKWCPAFAFCHVPVFALLARCSIWTLHAANLACPSIEIKTKQMGCASDLEHI